MTMRAFKVGNADRQRVTKVQAAYYPFWLRLELDIRVDKAVPPADCNTSRL